MIAFRRIGTIDPEAIRRAAARAWPKQSHGGREMPEYVVRAMYAEYQRTGSMAVAGKAFGRDPSSLLAIFHRRGLARKSRGGANHRLSDADARARHAVYLRAGSLGAAARELGCARSTLLYLFRSHGLPLLPNPHRKAAA